MLLVQHPRLIVELICFVQDFDSKWAKRTFIVRAITIVLNLFIVLYISRLVAIFEDDHKALAILLLIITGIASISVDTYFTLIYFYYWKHPELRFDRSGTRPIFKDEEEADKNEMESNLTFSKDISNTDGDESLNKSGITKLDKSSPKIDATESEENSKRTPHKIKPLMIN